MPIVGYSRASSFSPLQVGWTHAYWAEGPEFVALGLSDGGAVGTWPDEIGTLDATQGTAGAKPTYRATTGPNSKPTVQFDGGDHLATSALTQAQPLTMVFIASADSSVNTKYYAGNAAITIGVGYNNAPPVLRQLSMFAGAGVTGNSAASTDNNPHMMRAYFNGASSVNDLDGTTATVNPGTNDFSSSALHLGAVGGVAQLVGKMAFFAVFNGDVTGDAKWAQFKTWVTAHYGITVA